LSAQGFSVRVVVQPSPSADAVIVTEGLGSEEPVLRHWAVLQAAKAARRDGGVIVVLQRAGSLSGLEGLSRTLRKEWPGTQTYAWTVTDELANAAAVGIAGGFGDGVISAGHTLHVAEPGASLSPPTVRPDPDPRVWLVTGGARGVTAACAIELARIAGGTILLAGRSAETPWPDDLPFAIDLKALRGLLVERSRQAGERVTPAAIDQTARSLLAGAEIRDTLAAIRETGADAHYIALDAGNAAAVSEALVQAQARYGLITGLVHGAGVLADRLANDKTEAELRRVFAPKVGGLMNILAVLDPAQLKHVAFFSSAAAFFGNKGQSDYAMANALLASAGRSLARSYPSARVKVFHWGPWAGGMVDGALASHFEAQGIPLIPIREGARIFANELLAGDKSQIELVVGEAWATS
jgi:NAD(P)-dependent dehydrogenase (short-subunit alcohol dehydrogenase family)